MQILKKGVCFISSWSNIYVDSKFQVAMMAEEIVNKHITLEFVYEKTHEKHSKNWNFPNF